MFAISEKWATHETLVEVTKASFIFVECFELLLFAVRMSVGSREVK